MNSINMGSSSNMMAPGLIDNINVVPSNSLKRRRDSTIDLTLDDDESPQPKRPCYAALQQHQQVYDDPAPCGNSIAGAYDIDYTEVIDDYLARNPLPTQQMPNAEGTEHYGYGYTATQSVAPTRPTVAFRPMPAVPRPQMQLPPGYHQYGYGNTEAQFVAAKRPTVYGMNIAQLVAPERPAVSFAPVPTDEPAPTTPTTPTTPNAPTASQPSKGKKRSKRSEKASGAERVAAPPLTPEQQRDVAAKSQSFLEEQLAEFAKFNGGAEELWSAPRQAKKKADGSKRRAEEQALREARREEMRFQQESLKAVKDQERREKERAKAARLQVKKEKAAAKAARLQAKQAKTAAKTTQLASTSTQPAPIVNDFSADASYCGMAGRLTVASDGSWLKWVPLLQMHLDKAVDLQRQDADPVVNVGASKEDARKHAMKITTNGEEQYIFHFGTDGIARQNLVEAVEVIKHKPWKTEQIIEQALIEALTNAVAEEGLNGTESTTRAEGSGSSDSSEQNNEDMVVCTCQLPADDCYCDEEEEEEESPDGGLLILEESG